MCNPAGPQTHFGCALQKVGERKTGKNALPCLCGIVKSPEFKARSRVFARQILEVFSPPRLSQLPQSDRGGGGNGPESSSLCVLLLSCTLSFSRLSYALTCPVHSRPISRSPFSVNHGFVPVFLAPFFLASFITGGGVVGHFFFFSSAFIPRSQHPALPAFQTGGWLPMGEQTNSAHRWWSGAATHVQKLSGELLRPSRMWESGFCCKDVPPGETPEGLSLASEHCSQGIRSRPSTDALALTLPMPADSFVSPCVLEVGVRRQLGGPLPRAEEASLLVPYG